MKTTAMEKGLTLGRRIVGVTAADVANKVREAGFTPGVVYDSGRTIHCPSVESTGDWGASCYSVTYDKETLYLYATGRAR